MKRFKIYIPLIDKFIVSIYTPVDGFHFTECIGDYGCAVGYITKDDAVIAVEKIAREFGVEKSLFCIVGVQQFNID